MPISGILSSLCWKCCEDGNGTFVSSIRRPMEEFDTCCCLDRLESEHLGNMDQYQVTRHLDLPYQLDNRRWYEEEYKDDSS